MCQDQMVVCDEVDDLLTLLVIKRDEASVQNFKTGSFMWFQIFIEALQRMNDLDTARRDLVSLCKLVYRDNRIELRNIDEFRREYKAGDAIRWYTRPACFYRLLNRALRFQTYDAIISFRLLINNISRQLENEYHKQKTAIETGGGRSVLIVYRGQRMGTTEFNEIRSSRGEFVLINSFFSATTDKTAALVFAGATSTEKEIPVLIVIKADMKIEAKAFADIAHLSVFRDESEILFMLGCIFCIRNVSQNSGENYHTIELVLCSESDVPIRLTDTFDYYIKHKLPPQTDMKSLAHSLSQMNELKTAEKYLKRAYRETPDNELQRLEPMTGMGHVADELLLPNDLLIGVSHVNLRVAYYDLKEFDLALLQYKKALPIFNTGYPKKHPDFGHDYNNVAVAYAAKIDLSHANELLKKARDRLRKAGVPEKHPVTAQILSNIGVIFGKLEDYDEAIRLQQESLEIRQICLPPNHTDTAKSFHNLGIIYDKKNELDLALYHYQEALRMMTKCVPQDSRDYKNTQLRWGW
ncbi:unnamed protein product [Didymodactylos carnosus]|uniref:Uncharacterized protein n=1 Tax=Didymodactylos carnosus TaxID=1234261 RepID=A0A8S2NKF1_9BILA|nr:unnamed protein product [Didymodactylos carnosus]CAF4005240.1 unnamed protein product [Didymodactylos carnosus]